MNPRVLITFVCQSTTTVDKESERERGKGARTRVRKPTFSLAGAVMTSMMVCPSAGQTGGKPLWLGICLDAANRSGLSFKVHSSVRIMLLCIIDKYLFAPSLQIP